MLVEVIYVYEDRAHLLLPAFQFLDEEVVSFCDFAKFGIHTTLEVDKILPRLQGISRVLVALADDFIQVSHRHLGHEGFLDGSAKYGLHAGISALLKH